MATWGKSWKNSSSNLHEISIYQNTSKYGWKQPNSQLKTKNKSTPPLTPKSASSTPTMIESETPITTLYANNTSSSKPWAEDHLEIISIQDNKIGKLTKWVANLKQMLCEAQPCNLIATNASELLKMEVDKLKQYSCRWCLVISSVELPPNKATKSAEWGNRGKSL